MIETSRTAAFPSSKAALGTREGWKANPTAANVILAFVVVCAAAKLFAAWATGFAGDESYTVVISRTFALSYFDHPPLHQWIVHAFATAFGEGWWLRLPFWAMAIAINVPLFGLTRRLFGEGAALWTLFAFNAATYFLVWPDGLILPDVPLFLFLTSAIWAVAEILFGHQRSRIANWGLWLSAGIAFGLAGLSKYSAVFAPVGLFGFLAFSPRHRPWLWRPGAYLGAIVAFTIFSPALIWNYEHHWASFLFQSGRTSSGGTFSASAFAHSAEALGAQIALLSPWIGIPLILAIGETLRSRDPDSTSRFLLWLIAVPLLLFTVMPFLGKTTIPHWYNSAWLFAFPLLGFWLCSIGSERRRTWSIASGALSGAVFAAFTAYVAVGPVWQGPNAKAKIRDATQWSYDWRGLQTTAASTVRDTGKPFFLLVENWRVGGKAGVAFGPGVKVCAFTQDPREFAFLCDTRARLGEDALIVVPKESAGKEIPALLPYFERLEPGQDVPVGRAGRTERIVELIWAHHLLRPYPSPYGLGFRK